MSISALTFDESIFAAVAGADLFSFPLTEEELWTRLLAYQGTARSFLQMLTAVEEHLRSGRIERTDGCVHLPGRSSIVALRHERYLIAERKFSRALWFARICAACPFVRAIAVTNTLAAAHPSAKSDIDFFVVAAQGWLWSARFCTVGLAALFRLRHGERRAGDDPVCMSYFVSDHSLSLEPTALPPREGVPDIHLAQWAQEFCFLYDSGGVQERYARENGWIRELYPNAIIGTRSPRRTTQLFRGVRVAKKISECIVLLTGSILERFLRALQIRMLPDSVTAIANADTRVILNDGMLKFHTNDRRGERRTEFLEMLKRVTHQKATV